MQLRLDTITFGRVSGLLSMLLILGLATTTSQSIEPSTAKGAPTSTERVAVLHALDAALATIFPDYLAELPHSGARGSSAPAYDWLGGDGRAIKCRVVTAPRTCDLWSVHQAVHAAAAGAGAQVLWAERLQPASAVTVTALPEERDVLRMDLGLPGNATHTLLIRDPAAPAPAVCWEDVPAPLTAAELLGADDRPTVAIVLDDWGYGLTPAGEGLLELDVPLTLSILPGLPTSREVALLRTDLAVPALPSADDSRELRHKLGCPVDLDLGRLLPDVVPASRRETMLHLPMQPDDYPVVNPGRNAVMTWSSPVEIARIVETAVASLPGVSGVNNHMGSAATSDSGVMDHVMDRLAPHGLFFLDSRTSPSSVAYRTARRHGLSALENHVFLDEKEPTREKVRGQVERLLELAETRGFAVAIGHPYGCTLDVLREEIPRLQALGVRFVTVSELLALQGGEALAAVTP